MAVSKIVILLEIILLIMLCICSNASELNKKQKARYEIARLTVLGMVDPELFYDLMHTKNFDNNCPNRLTKMYRTHKEMWISHLNHKKISPQNPYWNKLGLYEFAKMYKIVNYIYIRNNLSSVLSFEDCFSIIHYTQFGSERITDDTDEGRQMRNAFYRLAIRQSKDPYKYHNSILYRGQSKLKAWYKEHYKNTMEQLTKFTSTTTSENVARRFAQHRKNETNKMSEIYEIYFPKPFLSANIVNITLYPHEKETVLLPETKLIIKKRLRRKGQNLIFWEEIQGIKYPVTSVDLKTNLTHNDENLSIFEQQKKVMIKLKELKDSGTKFYVDC